MVKEQDCDLLPPFFQSHWFMGTIIVSAMLVFFVPKFEPIFERMQERNELPWATTALMSLSAGIETYAPVLLTLLAVGVIAGIRYLQTDAGRLRYDRFRLASLHPGNR